MGPGTAIRGAAFGLGVSRALFGVFVVRPVEVVAGRITVAVLDRALAGELVDVVARDLVRYQVIERVTEHVLDALRIPRIDLSARDDVDRTIAHGLTLAYSASRPVAILLTCSWHGRSANELRERYATTDERPAEVVPYAVANDEAAFWLARHRAIVAGDALLGLGALQRCPDAWLEDRGGPEKLTAALRKLLELEPAFVLPSHGDPVVEDAARALAAAIEAPPFE